MTITMKSVRIMRKRGAIVLTHRQWGSKQTRLYTARRRDTRAGRWGKFKVKADTVVFHITVTFDDGVLTGEFKADCQEVERIGTERFGSGVSYNVLVDMETGMIGVGQPLDSKGTHTVNDKGVPGYSKDQNLTARAIGFIGMPGKQLSDAAVESAADVLMGWWEAGAITDDPDMEPHSLFAFKDCPTDAIRDRIPEIQRRFRARVKRAKMKEK